MVLGDGCRVFIIIVGPGLYLRDSLLVVWRSDGLRFWIVFRWSIFPREAGGRAVEFALQQKSVVLFVACCDGTAEGFV